MTVPKLTTTEKCLEYGVVVPLRGVTATESVLLTWCKTHDRAILYCQYLALKAKLAEAESLLERAEANDPYRVDYVGDGSPSWILDIHTFLTREKDDP